jgi:hypothetical protein
MDDAHGKEIDLQKTTIKIPGANKPRIGKSFINLEANKLQSEINSLNLNNLVTQSSAQIGSTDDIVNPTGLSSQLYLGLFNGLL